MSQLLLFSALVVCFEPAHGLLRRSSTSRLASISSNRTNSKSSLVPVDFFVFTSTDESGAVVRPEASLSIGGDERTTGFYALCKDECPVRTVSSKNGSYTMPFMEFCECIARLMVEDLNIHFGALVPIANQLGHLNSVGQVFSLGIYKEMDLGPGMFDIENGHKTLHELMDLPPTADHHRRPKHVTVWIANYINGHRPNTMLAGTTYLDMPLYVDKPGGAVLLQGAVSRNEMRLSHEVGHVVGFHHVAGPPVQYRYQHEACPSDLHVDWHMMSGPNCENNIMGGWYDGPYCCPWTDNSSTPFFLSKSHAGLSFRGSATCLPNSLRHVKQPYCCDPECTYKCPEEMPPMTFTTSEHKETLAKIYSCWIYLIGTEAPQGFYGLVQETEVLECIDYHTSVGSCFPSSRTSG